VLTNVGTGAARRLVINVVVPPWVDFAKPSPQWSELSEADVPTIETDGALAIYRVGRSEDFYPAMDLVVKLELEVRRTHRAHAGPSHMEVSVETEGLTPNGTRLLPSFAHKVGTQRAEFWTAQEWPGPKYWRWFRSIPRRIETIPIENVWCGPGRRIDRRSIDIG
jgi:hypothetical protein